MSIQEGCPVRITWDENKNRSNQIKHKVSFEVASLAFDDPCQLSRMDRVVDGEERWQTIGRVGSVLLLLVAHTWEDADGDITIRIISARKADAHERKRYEEEAV